MKKVVRILAVALVATASYAAVSTPKAVDKGQTLSMGSAPIPDCPPQWCNAK